MERLCALPAGRFLLILCLLAFGLRLGLVFALGNPEAPVMYEHGAVARNMLDGHGFAKHYTYTPLDPERLALRRQPPEYEGAYLPPASPYLIYGVFSLFGDTPFAASLLMSVNSLAGACLPLFVFFLGRQIGSESGARLSAIVAAGYPPSAFAVTSFSGSALYQPLSILVLLLAVASARRSSLGKFSALGLACGALALLRGEFLAFGIVLIAATAALRWRDGLAQFATRTAIALFAFALLVTPWLVRNYNVFGHFATMVSHPWHEIWRGNNPHASGSSWGPDGRSISIVDSRFRHIAQKLDQLPYDQEFEFAADRVFRAEVLEFAREQPLQITWLATKRVLQLWSLERYDPRAKHPVYVLCAVALMLLFYLGFWNLVRNSFRNRDFAPALIFALYFAMYSALIALTHLEARYQIYIHSSTFPLTGIGLLALLRVDSGFSVATGKE